MILETHETYFFLFCILLFLRQFACRCNFDLPHLQMLRVESNTKLEGFTEFEEGILFDEDDPDFDHSALQNMPILFRSKSIST